MFGDFFEVDETAPIKYPEEKKTSDPTPPKPQPNPIPKEELDSILNRISGQEMLPKKDLQEVANIIKKHPSLTDILLEIVQRSYL